MCLLVHVDIMPRAWTVMARYYNSGSEISGRHVALKYYFATKLQRWATVVATSKFARARDRVLRSNAGARGAGQQ